MASQIEKQQQEVNLFYSYQQALNQLETDHIEEGKTILKNLLLNPIIQHPDSKGIYYGVCISLAEIYGRENSIAEKCQSLYYYDLSNKIIENSWETFRKMAIIFRQIGLIPRAINLTLRALQYCNLPHIQPLLLHQVCCLAFLINEKEIFQKYFSMIPPDIKIKQQLGELDRYIVCQFSTPFVTQLLEEQQQILYKQQLIPQAEMEKEYFPQQYDCEISIDENNLKKFFKKIRKIFQACIIVEDGKDEIFFKDSSIFIKTSIYIKKKVQNNKTQIQNEIKPIVIKDLKISFKSKTQIQPQILNNSVKHFCLQSALEKNHSKIIEILKKNLPNSEIINFCDKQSFPNQNSAPIQTEDNVQPFETDLQIGIYLSQNLVDQKFLTINHLVTKLVELIFGLPSHIRVDIKQLNYVYTELIKCLIWVQFLLQNFSSDPKVDLKILFYTFKEFKAKLKNDKPKTAKQIIKLKLYQKLIIKLNDKLLFQTGIKKEQRDNSFQQSKEFKKIMTQIHNEFHIIKGQPQILIHPQMQKLAFQNNPAKLQQMNRILDFSIQEIIEFWDQNDCALEKGEQTNIHINKVKSFLREETKAQNYAQISKQIFNVCLKQLFQKTKKEKGKALLIYIKSIFETLYKQPQMDHSMAYACLKCVLIYNIFEEEASQPLIGFLKNCYQTLSYPKKQVLIIHLLQLNNINLHFLFQQYDLRIIIKDLNELRVQMKDVCKKLFKSYTDNFQENPEVQFYIAHLINKKPGVYSQCIVKQHEAPQQQTINNDQIILNSPPEFSSESEDEYRAPYQYSANFKDIKLTVDQICEPFQLAYRKYKFSKVKIQYLLEHKISVNLGEPKIVNQIKKLVKEVLKQNIQISTKQLKSQFLVHIFKNYYFHPDYAAQKADENELKFFGYYLPLIYDQYQDKKQLNTFINNVIYQYVPKIINALVYQYSDSLQQHIFSKQPLKSIPKFKELSDLVVQENQQCDYMANIYYLLHIAKADEKNFQYLLIAIAFNDQPFFWQQLYMQLFELALEQLNFNIKSAQLQNDWFICQKKVQVILQKTPSLQYLYEYRFIMDLLKAQQRQMEYQNTLETQLYAKVQQAYSVLLQQNSFTVPNDVIEIKHNFRAMLLIEKKILRKLRNISMERIYQSINNFRQLNSLILQIKSKQITYFYNSADGEFEIIQDFQINIYKYLKRFLKNNLQYHLKELVGMIETLHPILLQPVEEENLVEFAFLPENKPFKNQDMPKEQQAYQLTQQENVVIEKKVYIILSNLLQFFSQLIQRLNVSQPQRYVIESIYYYCHILMNSTLPAGQLAELISKKISLVYSNQQKDIINYQKHYHENYSSEQDQVLRYYYHHDLVFQYQKSKMIKLVIKSLFMSQQWQELIDLFEKVQKTYDKRAIQIIQGFIKKHHLITSVSIFKEVIFQCENFVRRLPLETVSINKEDYYKMLLRMYEVEFASQFIIGESIADKIYKVKKYFLETYSKIRKPKPDIPQEQKQQQKYDEPKTFYSIK